VRPGVSASTCALLFASALSYLTIVKGNRGLV